jgi:MFS family permease
MRPSVEELPSSAAGVVGRLLKRLALAFRPPALPSVSRRAFRFHLAYTLLDSISAGILANVPLMAVKVLRASDGQLQVPISMTSAALFASVITGSIMARRRKMPFILVPGLAGVLSMLTMAWLKTPLTFLCAAGVVSICDFSTRPAIPSILRSVYPKNCRSHVAGTLRQYASVLFPAATLSAAALLSFSGARVQDMIRLQLTLGGLVYLGALVCIRQLPDKGDGSPLEADPALVVQHGTPWRLSLEPLRDPAFRMYLAAFGTFVFSNLFFMGIVPVFFAKDLGMDYVQANLVIHVLPAIVGFVAGGRLTAWFDRTSVWLSYGLVTLLWGLDPLLLATGGSWWPALILARVCRGPAMVGSIVIAVYTGVHSFARPGPDTSRYAAVLMFVNGLGRLLAPIAAAMITGYVSHSTILLIGSVGTLAASAKFVAGHRRFASTGRTEGRSASSLSGSVIVPAVDASEA